MGDAAMGHDLPKLFGVIGVWYRGDRTFYVKRSDRMRNYPGVWSLPSIQFDPAVLTNNQDLGAVQRYVNMMSAERFGGVPIRTLEFLTSGDSDENPIGMHVFLYLYRIEMRAEPVLNPEYYTDMKWMTAEQYERASYGQQCGLCMRLWSDYAWLRGITDRPFIPHRKPLAAAFDRLFDAGRSLTSWISRGVDAT
jgi:hypothetical protein